MSTAGCLTGVSTCTRLRGLRRAGEAIDCRRLDQDTQWPHSGLGYLNPEVCARELRKVASRENRKVAGIVSGKRRSGFAQGNHGGASGGAGVGLPPAGTRRTRHRANETEKRIIRQDQNQGMSILGPVRPLTRSEVISPGGYVAVTVPGPSGTVGPLAPRGTASKFVTVGLGGSSRNS